ncbi:hypothetical protein PHYPSEUDO_005341 [Phytophthora pseudosyringae]|uniref:Uncharacterized protein n=1 Tax=Phytophthora pseudosyringae TaxID=221518 RepID=A0A8T1VL99_9STRA|nr:hypothetical protein PHYPSEUDO_005341 [Phytophthora pseudosyringae]
MDASQPASPPAEIGRVRRDAPSRTGRGGDGARDVARRPMGQPLCRAGAVLVVEGSTSTLADGAAAAEMPALKAAERSRSRFRPNTCSGSGCQRSELRCVSISADRRRGECSDSRPKP